MTATEAGCTLRFDSERLEEVARRFGLRLVVLYGSHARGRADAASDLDVAVLGCAPEAFWDCYQALADVFGDGSLDLVRLEDADSLLRYEILRDGIRLFGDPDFFCGYRAYAFRDYVDSADLRALEARLFERKMARMKEELHGPP